MKVNGLTCHAKVSRVWWRWFCFFWNPIHCIDYIHRITRVQRWVASKAWNRERFHAKSPFDLHNTESSKNWLLPLTQTGAGSSLPVWVDAPWSVVNKNLRLTSTSTLRFTAWFLFILPFTMGLSLPKAKPSMFVLSIPFTHQDEAVPCPMCGF